MKYLIVIFITFLIIYLTTSFIQMDFNPVKWAKDARAVAGVFGLIVTCCACGVLYDNSKPIP